MKRIIGWARRSEVLGLLDNRQPEGSHINLGLDHPGCWLEDEPYPHLMPVYIHESPMVDNKRLPDQALRNDDVTGLQQTIAKLRAELAAANANAINLIERNGLLRQRPDLPVDRIPAHQILEAFQKGEVSMWYVWFEPQYGLDGRWTLCRRDQHGVWTCGGCYMPAPYLDRIAPVSNTKPTEAPEDSPLRVS